MSELGKHALVAFGANLSFGELSPAALVEQAISRLSEGEVRVLRRSPLYLTPCFPAGAGPDYVNAAAVVLIPGQMTPEAFLARLHAIEAEFGRARDLRWGGRTLDIDLIAVGTSVLPDAETQDQWRNLAPERQAQIAPDRLILPHPRMQDRAFVLGPLADVAPDWRHPRLGRTVAELFAALSPEDRAALRLFQ